jgi:hypothetical protein
MKMKIKMKMKMKMTRQFAQQNLQINVSKHRQSASLSPKDGPLSRAQRWLQPADYGLRNVQAARQQLQVTSRVANHGSCAHHVTKGCCNP